jgi:hypothetical protein
MHSVRLLYTKNVRFAVGLAVNLAGMAVLVRHVTSGIL